MISLKEIKSDYEEKLSKIVDGLEHQIKMLLINHLSKIEKGEDLKINIYNLIRSHPDKDIQEFVSKNLCEITYKIATNFKKGEWEIIILNPSIGFISIGIKK